MRLYLEARYRKLVRGLPQTIFYCPKCKGRRCAYCGGFGKLTRDSVQELLARKILSAYRGREGKFHGAGREDHDVRMLGTGRPFIYEVVGPRNFDVDLGELRQTILEYTKDRVEITDFVPVNRARVAAIKEARTRKLYRALVDCERAVPSTALEAIVGESLVAKQKTPERVAHRRADKLREREVRIVALEACSERHGAPPRLDLRIDCEHGTYVKEWISGEDGRSQPSLSDLLDCSCHCAALDVLAIADSSEDSGEGVFTSTPSFENDSKWPPLEFLDEDPWGLLEEHREKGPDAGREPRAVSSRDASLAPDGAESGRSPEEG